MEFGAIRKENFNLKFNPFIEPNNIFGNDAGIGPFVEASKRISVYIRYFHRELSLFSIGEDTAHFPGCKVGQDGAPPFCVHIAIIARRRAIHKRESWEKPLPSSTISSGKTGGGVVSAGELSEIAG